MTIDRPDLLSAVLEAAGGLKAFEQVRSIETTVDVSGLLWPTRGCAERTEVEGFVDTKSSRTVYHHLGGHLDEPNLRWTWTPDRVWIERADGTVLQSRDCPRNNLLQKASSESDWDDLDLLYFRGYAIFNYLLAPYYFTWPGFTTRELESHIEGAETWRVLEVTYPNRFPGHGKVQTYYYDDQYQLRRLDYAAEVVGGAPAAHYVFDEKRVDGFSFPTLRRAVRKHKGKALPSLRSLVLLNFHRIVVRKEADAPNP